MINRFPFLVLAIFWVILILIVNPIGDFPLNDDWQYAFPVKSLIEEGTLVFQGVFAPNIILQVVWGYFFCWIGGEFDFTILRISTLVLAFLGGVLVYKIAKLVTEDYRLALLGSLLMLLNPLYFVLSFSFMTDVPFLTLALLSVHCFLIYLKKNNTGWLLGALLSAIGSFLIRQPGIVLPIAFAIFLILDRRAWRLAGVLAGIAVLTYFSYENLGKPYLGITENYVSVSSKFVDAFFENPLNFALELIKKVLKTFIYIGFFALPLLPYLWSRLRSLGLFSQRIFVIVFLANAALFFFLLFIGKTFPFGGNILYNFGLGPELLADVYTLGLPNTQKLPGWIMLVLQVISQLSATYLLLLIDKRISAFYETGAKDQRSCLP